MDVGILYHNAKQYPPHLAVRIGAGEFNRASHTRGHQPTIAMFNPLDLPAEEELAGLQVKGNRFIPRHHIRVCTRDMTPAEELAAERAAMERLLAGEMTAQKPIQAV